VTLNKNEQNVNKLHVLIYWTQFLKSVCHNGGWGSLASIVSDYRQDYRGSIPGRGKEFFFQPLCPVRLWKPPILHSSDTGGTFPGVKSGRGVILITYHYLVQRISRGYTASPSWRLHGDSGTALLFYLPYVTILGMSNVAICWGAELELCCLGSISGNAAFNSRSK
jgi:hypothetical protein